jgi:hypothetical protein
MFNSPPLPRPRSPRARARAPGGSTCRRAATTRLRRRRSTLRRSRTLHEYPSRTGATPASGSRGGPSDRRRCGGEDGRARDREDPDRQHRRRAHERRGHPRARAALIRREAVHDPGLVGRGEQLMARPMTKMISPSLRAPGSWLRGSGSKRCSQNPNRPGPPRTGDPDAGGTATGQHRTAAAAQRGTHRRTATTTAGLEAARLHRILQRLARGRRPRAARW